MFSNKLTCTKCFHTDKVQEEFNDIISSPANTVIEFIDDCFRPILIDDFICNKCRNKVTIAKIIKMEILPKMLCIVVNRFNYDTTKNT